tara:strand:+ start:1327 stop:1602 length:276 start_codon:yes stop_codon:yes gene_type:complete
MKQTYSNILRTIDLANLALDVTNESLFINNIFNNNWEIVILDQRGRVTNHKFLKNLNNNEIINWIDNWVTNQEIIKSFRLKRITSQFKCYT